MYYLYYSLGERINYFLRNFFILYLKVYNYLLIIIYNKKLES